MRVTLNIPASKAALTAAMEGLTQLDYVLMGRTRFAPLYESGIRYERELRVGGHRKEEWRNIDELHRFRVGDCEDLAAARAAELRREGIPARAVAVRTGRKKFHAIVLWPDGSYEDPSRELGMKG